MTQLTALKELAEKVEAGEKPPTSGFVDEPIGPNTWGHSVQAYDGSLDAAKAMHEAVLPGYATKHHAATGNCWHFYVKKFTGGPEHKGIAEPPARAWLLAIIRAKISELES